MRLTQHEIEMIAGAFVAARRDARRLDDFPLRLPERLDDSIAIQEAALRLTGETVAGWKVAMVPPPLRIPLAADRLAGPVDARTLRHCAEDATVEVAVHADGFAALEAEFVVVMRDEPRPGPDGFTAEGVRAAVASIHAGVEVASSPLPTLNDLGPLAVVCDHGNNAGVVVGPEIVGWRDRMPTLLTTRTHVDGRSVGEGSAASIPGGPLGAVAWLAGHLAARGRRLGAGDIVSTGMTTGVHPVRPGQRARVEFAHAGGFDLTVAALRPRASEAAP